MRVPRFTISGMMALVLVVALDAGACKALLGGPDLTDLILFGALPMANVLALGLYPILMSRYERQGGRPGWVGFEVGGLAALLFYLACSLTMTHPLHEGVGHLLRAIGLVPSSTIFLAGAVVLLLLPQLALAILGAQLGRIYKLWASANEERRAPSNAGPERTPELLARE
jgi:hypothetical protein